MVKTEVIVFIKYQKHSVYPKIYTGLNGFRRRLEHGQNLKLSLL